VCWAHESWRAGGAGIDSLTYAREPMDLVYDRFALRLDGPMIRGDGSRLQGAFRLHVDFAQASVTPQKNGVIEVYVDDGGGLDRPFLQEKINGVWGVWKYQLPVAEESALVGFFAEAERRRVSPRPTA
jgi:hypothetical protein